MVKKVTDFIGMANSQLKNNEAIIVRDLRILADDISVDIGLFLRFINSRGEFIDFSSLRIRNVYNGNIPTIHVLEEVEDQMYEALFDCIMKFLTEKYPVYLKSGKLDDLYMNIQEE